MEPRDIVNSNTSGNLIYNRLILHFRIGCHSTIFNKKRHHTRKFHNTNFGNITFLIEKQTKQIHFENFAFQK